MGNIKSFREIMEHACINRAEIHNETAELEFDVSGTEDGKALITYFDGEWMISQLFVSVTHYERIEELEDGLDEEFRLVEEDSFYENLEIVNCHCSLSVNIQNGDIVGSVVFTGTHEEKPFTAEPIHFDADHVFIQSEGTDLLLFLTEQHSELSKNPADHYEEEIKNLFFCDSVRRHVKTLVD
ncbi:MAG: hypothetical protein MJ175_07285, partial [Clostridia bacterium]|nr:hypothetical protein [Clostridia bacterium]